MAPVIVESSQNYKEIRIEKNDNAEGTIEFLPEAQSFIGEYRNSFIDSEVTGLQLDMGSALGSQNYKEIRIEMNENAEGTIEFLPEAQSSFGEYRNSFIDSELAGLQFGMGSALGSHNYKEIRKEMNDNAEGTVEFLPEAQSFFGEYRNSFIDSEVAGL